MNLDLSSVTQKKKKKRKDGDDWETKSSSFKLCSSSISLLNLLVFM